MTEENSDEWTFVPPKKSSSRKGNTTKKRQSQLAKARQLYSTIHHDEKDNNNDTKNKPQDTEALKQRLILTIDKCIREMKEFGQGQGHQTTKHKNHLFDLQTLVKSIQDAVKSNESIDDNDECEHERGRIDEIICYGIGNFYGARDNRYNAPLVQLACVLALREALSKEANVDVSNDSQEELQVDVDQVSIVYFEPFIKPIEREVLAHYHVKVLDSNEQGKRRVAKDCRIYDDASSLNPSPSNRISTCSTLFYMPHCPMRLYSNVLWANWEKELILGGRMIIFGNSFKAYDERIISFEKKKGDKTNAIFPLLPYSCEVDILSLALKEFSRNRSRDGLSTNMNSMNTLCGQDLEMAFNDCVVISFQDDASIPFPSQPDEYIVAKDGDGELI
jgi:hypothetical protein